MNEPVWDTLEICTKTDYSYAFDKGWAFCLNSMQPAQAFIWDDSNWERIDFPHDFSLSQDYTPDGEAESGYKLGGIGWYRKSFFPTQDLEDQSFILQFEGSYLETDVYINGHFLGTHRHGYVSFGYDVTSFVRIGQENRLAIRVRHSVPSSRWYSGSGLYRSVSMTVRPKFHLVAESLWVKQAPIEQLTKSPTKLQFSVQLAVENQSSHLQTGRLRYGLRDCVTKDLCLLSEREIPSLEAGEKHVVNLELSVSDILLWFLERPSLYQLELELIQEGRVVHHLNKEIGFRELTFDAERGCKLNGKPLKIKGVCLHHDQGSLGACAYPDAIERQLILMKDMGANTIRVTHQPSSPILRTIANRQGMLLIDEAFDTWLHAKNGNQYDVSACFLEELGIENTRHLVGNYEPSTTWAHYVVSQMVLAGRNDPSIILWSVGNELMEGFAADVSQYPAVLQRIIRWVDQLDGSRPLTIGDNKLKEIDFPHQTLVENMAELLTNQGKQRGVIGHNYAKGWQYDTCHKEHPSWILYGSETASAINSRSVYDPKGSARRADKQLTSYDQHAVPWGARASEAWYDTIQRDFVAGECVWTGFDYLGEPTPWNGTEVGAVDGWPSPKHSYFGIVDTAGFPKDSYYFYQSQWQSKDTIVHLLPTWNKEQISIDADGTVEVVVYTNAASVELFFTAENGNQRSLGCRSFTTYQTPSGHSYRLYQGEGCSGEQHQNLYLTWHVPYQKGSIEAVAYDEKGVQIKTTHGRSRLQPFGKASQLVALPFAPKKRTSPGNLTYVTIEVRDEDGNLVTNAQPTIQLELSGPARLLALDNGNSMDFQSYQASDRKAFGGLLLAIVERLDKGEVKLSAKSPGLRPTSLKLPQEVRTSNGCPLIYQFKKVIYWQPGEDILLPQTIRIQDGDTIQDLPVCYEKTALDEKKAGQQSFSIQASIAELSICLTVSVIRIVGDLHADTLLYDYTSGRQLNLPPFISVRDGAQQELPRCFPVYWGQAEEHLENHHQIKGYADIFGERKAVAAEIVKQQATFVRYQDVTQMATRKNVEQKEGRITYRFSYDTAQSLGEISLAWKGRAPQKVEMSYGQIMEDLEYLESFQVVAQSPEECSYIFRQPIPVVCLEMTVFFESIPADFLPRVRLWTVKEEVKSAKINKTY